MPPSAITGTPYFLATLAASKTAVNCGTPMPAMIRVVQILPGPTPTLIASAPAKQSASAASPVAILPQITCKFGKAALMRLRVSITPFEWPWAVSMLTTSTPALMRACTRSSMSGVTPMAAPQSNRPRESLAAFGRSFFFRISR